MPARDSVALLSVLLLDLQASGDAHSVLNVPAGAPKDVIKRAYRKLVLRTHPDIAHDGGSEERFIQVSINYVHGRQQCAHTSAFL